MTEKDNIGTWAVSQGKSWRTTVASLRSDKVIWSIVFVLVLISILAVYSATGSLAYKEKAGHTEFYLVRQLLITCAGLGIIYFVHLINYKQFRRMAVWFYAISIPLLLVTLLYGTNLNDANRWINLPVLNLSFQTSDFARLALYMYLARQLSRKQDVIKDFRNGYLPLIAPIALTCALIAPANLSTALLTGATGMLILFMGRASVKHLLYTAFVFLIPVIFLVLTAVFTYDGNDAVAKTADTEMVQTMRSKGRVGTWINRVQQYMYSNDDNLPYQVQQANIAIAKGKWVGLGPGNSEQRNFLPHSYSDFIYAIIIEEYGFIGGVLLLILYMVFLYRCIRLQRRFPYAFGTFLAMALSVTLIIQALANMGVNVGLLPVTGVTLPLVSMGGTSIIFTCLSIGFILSVARNLEMGNKENFTEDDFEENDIDKEEVAHV